MNTTNPDDAQRALAEIQGRQADVIDRVLVPTWYWWAVAIPTVVLGLVVDIAEPAVVAAAAILFAVGVAAATLWIVFGGLRRVKVDEAILGPDGAVLIAAFVGLLVVGSLIIAFGLRAAGFAYPATAATAACAVGLVVGGPMLMARLRDTMRRRRAGISR